MRIALLSDVHANLPALEAVLTHAQTQQVDEFWSLGDMIGYGPFPNEVISRLREVCSRQIVGNYDLKALSRKRAEEMRAAGKDPEKAFSFEWTNKALSARSVDFIKKLSAEQRAIVDGISILLVHGSPNGMEDGLTSRTSMARFHVLAQEAKADLVLCGHTHEAFERQTDKTAFINPGSIGRSFDGDPRPSYCVLEILAGKVRAKFFRVECDLLFLADVMRQQGFPDRLICSLQQGRSLEGLVASASADRLLQSVLELARECRYEKEHAHQVTRLALRFYDDLSDWHGLGAKERVLLQAGALLHDVGVIYGAAGHHKASRDIILKASQLLLSDRERVIVALLARYHRRSHPDKSHRYYQDLAAHDQELVDLLAGILRVADGLDRRHQSVVKDVGLKLTPQKVVFALTADIPPDDEIAFAREKGDLFASLFGRALEFRRAE